jgi:hypothetical protein
VNINLNETHTGRKDALATQSEPVIEPFPNYQNQICLVIRLECSAIQRWIGVSHAQRMSVRDDTARHRNGVKRKKAFFDELSQLDLRAGPPDSAAGNHHRTFRGTEHPKRPVDLRGVRARRRNTDRSHHIWCLRLASKKVSGYSQMDCTLSPVICFGVRTREIKRNLSGCRRLSGPFHDRPGHRDLVDILKTAAVSQCGGPASTHRDERAAGQVRCCDSCQRIGVARAAGNERNRRPPVKPRPGIGRVSYTRFVPYIDDVNSLAGSDGQHFIQMLADERKDVPDTELCDGPDEQLGARWHTLPCPVPNFYDMSGPPVEEIPDVFNGELQAGLKRLRSDACGVRRKHYVFEPRGRMAGRQWLCFENIQAGASNAA